MLFSFLYAIIIGGIVGYLAGLIRRGSGYGILGNIIIGILGGFVGNIIFGLFGFEYDNFIASFLVALAGAIILLSIVNLITKSSATH